MCRGVYYLFNKKAIAYLNMAITIQSLSIHMPNSSRCRGSVFFNLIVHILSSCGGYDKVNIFDGIFNILYIFKTQYCPLCFTRLCYCFCLHGSEASIVFQGFAFLGASFQLRGKKLLRLVLLVSLNLLY